MGAEVNQQMGAWSPRGRRGAPPPQMGEREGRSTWAWSGRPPLGTARRCGERGRQPMRREGHSEVPLAPGRGNLGAGGRPSQQPKGRRASSGGGRPRPAAWRFFLRLRGAERFRRKPGLVWGPASGGRGGDVLTESPAPEAAEAASGAPRDAASQACRTCDLGGRRPHPRGSPRHASSPGGGGGPATAGPGWSSGRTAAPRPALPCLQGLRVASWVVS